MANEKQLKILEQGIKVWNQWREEPLDKKIDLQGAHLEGAHLTGANLEGAHLEGAHLEGAHLEGAILQGAHLEGADLRWAHLEGATLRGAHLTRADLQIATLRGANLRGANLRGAHLKGATLRGATLKKADLQGAHLTETNLRGTDLRGVDLQGAHLEGADLRGADLEEADLQGANLTGADLREAKLIQTNINGIICDYVYWDSSHKERTPKNRTFRPGEFEELYKSLPTFEYYFEDRFNFINIYVMDQAVQAINERHQEFNLKLKNFEVTGTPHATFTVVHSDYVEPAKAQLTTDYETRIAALEGKHEQLRQVLSTLVAGGFHITAGGDVIMEAD